MARNLNKLTNTLIKSSNLGPGRHSDGGGLYLRVRKSGSKSWVFLWNSKDRKSRKEMGMGSYPAISLAQARKLAMQYRIDVAEGRDPIKEKKKTVAPAFEECAAEYIEMRKSEWSNKKHAAQWVMTLGPAYCGPIQKRQISEIDTDDVIDILQPIWLDKAETASRLRARLENLFDYAKTKGWRSGENPARWRGHLKHLLPKQNPSNVKHMAAMPYNEVPKFIKAIEEIDSTASKALQFLVLTATRSNEVRFARWHEIDFVKANWTIPAERMKMKREYIVPLSKPALEILQKLSEASLSDFLFPGIKTDNPISEMTMLMLMRRRGVENATVHGFRSSFRDWAGDETDFSREVAEAALAHKTGNDVEAAYRRSTALEKRRGLMEEWGEFCQI